MLRLHACPCPDPTACSRSGFDWSWVKGPAYCISLQDTDDRMKLSAAQFHRVGLCTRVQFYRPVRDTTPGIPRPGTRGCWESHRAVCMLAEQQGAHQALIFEDDVVFKEGITPAAVARVRASFEALPQQWDIFYLGHWPFYGVPKTKNLGLWRTHSNATHAYVANATLLAWFRAHPFDEVPIPHDGVVWLKKHGQKGFDNYVGHMLNYAAFPMIAYQRGLETTNPKATIPAGNFIQAFLNPAGFKFAEIGGLFWMPLVAAATLTLLAVLLLRQRRASGGPSCLQPPQPSPSAP